MNKKEIHIFRCLSSQAGLTLIEIILVVVFIGVALTTLLNSFNVGIRSSVDSEYISVATQLAELKMEEIKSDKASFGYGYIIQSNYPAETDPNGYLGYVRTVTINDYANYKEVEVTVAQDQNMNITLTTIFTNY